MLGDGGSQVLMSVKEGGGSSCSKVDERASRVGELASRQEPTLSSSIPLSGCHQKGSFTFRVHLPTSNNLIRSISHKTDQQLSSYLSLEPVK